MIIVEGAERISHCAVEEGRRGLPVSRVGNDSVRNFPRPTPGGSKSTHQVRKIWPRVVQMRVVDSDHFPGQLALDQPLIVPVLDERLFLSLDEVKCDGLPAGVVKVLRTALRFALHRVDVREVGSTSVLANNPEPRAAPAGPRVQPTLEMGDLARPFCRLTNCIEHWVIPFDERYEIGMIPLISNALTILIAVQ